MDDMRAQLDAQCVFIPPQDGPTGTKGFSVYDKYIDFIANHGEKDSAIINQKRTGKQRFLILTYPITLFV